MPKQILKFLAVHLIFMLCQTTSWAQMRFLVSSDVDYRIAEGPDIRVIYTAEEAPLVQELVSYQRVFKDVYQREFAWELDEKPTYVLASAQNQIANGFATVFPQLHTVFYNGGPELIDEFGVNSWLYVLMSHETVHLYQLNAKSGYSQTIKKYFGNSSLGGTAFLPPFMYVQHPNIFLPTFLTEGNATYNEGRFGNGGRLYNGAIRALFLDMMKTGQVNMPRLMNDNIDFPYGSEKYWVGGYFQLYLAEKYGAERVNAFFMQHTGQRWNPLQINRTFYRVFGTSYDQALQDMLITWAPLTTQQAEAPETPLFTSLNHAGLTRDANEIRVLTSDRVRPPVLHIFNLKKQKWSEERVHMPIGRVFRRPQDHALAAASGESVSNNEIRYGLFTDGYGFDKKQLNRIYFDIQENNELWVDTKKSFRQSQLFHNGRNVGTTASSAIIGQNSEAYFFTQKNKTRTMMSNGTELFTYQGYYGFPVAATADNQVYFIGPAERGSTLYLWESGQFFRLHPSDRIVDASIVSSEKALITEVNANGYAYKWISLKKESGAPFEYKYFYENEKLFQTFADLENATTAKVISGNKYSGVRNLEYNGVDPYIFYGTDTPVVGGLDFRFSDPLRHHFVTAQVASGSFGEHAAGFNYQNKEYILNWDFLAQYQKRAKVAEDPTQKSGYDILDRYDAWVGGLGLDWDIFRRPLWKSNLDSHFFYEYEDPKLAMNDTDQKYTWLNQWGLDYKIGSALGFQPYRTAALKVGAENQRSAPDWNSPRQIYGATANVSQDILYQTYLSAGYQAIQTDGQNAIVELDSAPDDLPYPTVTRILRNTPYYSQNYFSVQKVSAELKQAFRSGVYFKVLPLSLRRIAVLGAFHEYYGSLTRHTTPDTLFREVGGGAEFELLFFHRFPIRVQLTHYMSSFNDETNTAIVIGM